MSDPNQASHLAAVMFAGWLMVQAGVGKRVLHWRMRDRRCPSCGRARRDCRCGRT